MSLFGFGKKEETSAGNIQQPVEGEEKVHSVKVLGSGCKSCHALYENAKEAVAALGWNLEVEYVTDLEKIVAYGAMSMPALVVNESVVSGGKVLKPAEVETFLRKSAETAV